MCPAGSRTAGLQRMALAFGSRILTLGVPRENPMKVPLSLYVVTLSLCSYANLNVQHLPQEAEKEKHIAALKKAGGKITVDADGRMHVDLNAES